MLEEKWEGKARTNLIENNQKSILGRHFFEAAQDVRDRPRGCGSGWFGFAGWLAGTKTELHRQWAGSRSLHTGLAISYPPGTQLVREVRHNVLVGNWGVHTSDVACHGRLVCSSTWATTAIYIVPVPHTDNAQAIATLPSCQDNHSVAEVGVCRQLDWSGSWRAGTVLDPKPLKQTYAHTFTYKCIHIYGYWWVYI